jgi:TrpR-related protein YerC/YecD
MDVLHQKSIERLFMAIMSLESLEEYYDFFEDACTIKEIQEIAQRFDVATQLWQGKNYNEVNQSTGASTATICRVKKCLMYGRSGYRLALERIGTGVEE